VCSLSPLLMRNIVARIANLLSAWGLWTAAGCGVWCGAKNLLICQLLTSSSRVLLVNAAVDSLVSLRRIWFLHNASCRRTSKAPPWRGRVRFAGGSYGRSVGDAGRLSFSPYAKHVRCLVVRVDWDTDPVSHSRRGPPPAILTRQILALARTFWCANAVFWSLLAYDWWFWCR